ncbi:hypothetical protein HDU97_004606 [Phlyctochytrium planicorne]|nr:hypothetical protein HDU97_004606 [Phlyctochytrium planicorne]
MFIREWQLYREMLSNQIVESALISAGAKAVTEDGVAMDGSDSAPRFGRNLTKNEVDALRDDQIGQLFALKQEVFTPEDGEKKI